jgi:hypothetical protein
VVRLLPLLAGEYRRRLTQLRDVLARRRSSPSPPESDAAGGSLVLEDTIEAARFVVGLLAIGLAFIGVSIVLRQRAPTAQAARATLEYSAVFLLYFAVVMFKNGIVGRRGANGAVFPASDWLQRSWAEAAKTFAVTILLAVASLFVVTVVLPLLTLGAVVLFLMFLAALDRPTSSTATPPTWLVAHLLPYRPTARCRDRPMPAGAASGAGCRPHD